MYGDALTTKARIKERLGITATTFDDLIDNLILAVTKRISQMCNRRFTQATFTHELHDGSDAYGSLRVALIIKNAPIQTLSAVQYNVGTYSNPDWDDFHEDSYTLDADAGILYFTGGLPRGKQNIRVTYTGGFSGYSIGLTNYWTYNVVPTGTVDGSNLTFTLPVDADEIVVYADGLRIAATNYTFVAGSATFTLDAGQAPFSTIVVDYLSEASAIDSEDWLPADLVEVAEAVVTRIYKRRDSEGRLSESFGESSISWTEGVYTKEDLATIKNYRRGYNL